MFKFKFSKIFFVLVFFTIFVILTFKFTYSKFIQSKQVNSSSQIAKFAFDVESLTDEVAVDNLKENEEVSYKFRVKNFSNNVSSEVKTNYNISLQLSQDNPPLIIELYRIDGQNENLIELENYSTKTSESFDIGENYKDYKVKVKFDKTNLNQLNKDFNISLKVTGVQKEG